MTNDSTKMSRTRLNVVLSQAPGKHPAKRALEESIAAALIMEPGLDVSIIPNLYDLGPDHTGRMFLEGVAGDIAILSWHFPRAAFWLLDRIGIKGHEGAVLLKPPASNDDEDEESEAAAGQRGRAVRDDPRSAHLLPGPARLQLGRPLFARGSPHRRRMPATT